jgi:rare lipoprotein A (peptidoglycan hydrolase)
MSLRPRRALRALVALALVAVALSAGGRLASASDLETLRERAQAIADGVSGLEKELAALGRRRSRLESMIATRSAEIGVIEAELHDAERAYEEALDSYIGRAVEAYKSGSTGRFALLLSSRNMDELFARAEAQFEAASLDADALRDLAQARAAAERAQERIDMQKQKLLAANAEVEAITAEVEQTVAQRRSILRELAARVKELERRARLAAAQAARPDQAFMNLLAPSGPAPGIPKGFIGTGVTFEGIASWYGPGFEGNPTASGDIFDPSLFTAASRDLPLGTWLHVTHGGRGVVVLVNDRGPYIDDRILDLSQAAAQAIGITGLGWIEAEIIIKA